MSGECFICGDDHERRLQEHHLVPKRYGGSDTDENLVTLCASCHQAIEQLYDDEFYNRLGVTRETNSPDLTPVESIDEIEEEDVLYSEPHGMVMRLKRRKPSTGYRSADRSYNEEFELLQIQPHFSRQNSQEIILVDSDKSDVRPEIREKLSEHVFLPNLIENDQLYFVVADDVIKAAQRLTEEDRNA